MKYSPLLVSLFGLRAMAFPRAMMGAMAKRQVASTTAAQKASAARGNCGTVPCLVFNADDQYVSNTGQYAYASPSPSDIRGPCPGLNAAANHGYISRSGVLTIADTVAGLEAAYGMSPELGGFLAAYAIIFDGDPVLGTWSIGGPQEGDPLTKGLIGAGQGISWSHNVYEGDSSIGRSDAYINNGDAYSLIIDRFMSAYEANENDRYTLDLFAQNFADKAQESEATNPYYFAAPFSTTLVSPAAYNFVINFMSNHTAEEPNGYLNGAIFKEFFAVTGEYPNFTWQPGQEKIPDNWYKRTSTNYYNAVNTLQDLAVQFAAYPQSVRLGGNTNGVNTYEGLDLSDITGGVYHTSDLLDPSGQGAACFYAQFIQSIIPDSASVALEELSAIDDLINQYIKPITGGADCAEIDKYDQTPFNKFPGHSYSPTGPAVN